MKAEGSSRSETRGTEKNSLNNVQLKCKNYEIVIMYIQRSEE